MRLTATLVAKMRAAQKEYFRTRSRVSLSEAKQLEAAVDEAIAEIVRNHVIESVSDKDNQSHTDSIWKLGLTQQAIDRMSDKDN
jgi:hypothetical protein